MMIHSWCIFFLFNTISSLPIIVLTKQHIVGVHTEDLRYEYNKWISAWLSHLDGSAATAIVLLKATVISTPLKVNNWKRKLARHPNRQLVEFFIAGLTDGFQIGYKEQPKPLRSAKRNLSCALQHPDTVQKYLTEEIACGHVAGPFPSSLAPLAHISRFGVIPKNHQPNKWRLIVDLSHPIDGSVKGGIPKALCSLKYITVDSAIECIKQIGQGIYIASQDRY